MIVFQANLGKFGQSIFAPPKNCLLQYLCPRSPVFKHLLLLDIRHEAFFRVLLRMKLKHHLSKSVACIPLSKICDDKLSTSFDTLRSFIFTVMVILGTPGRYKWNIILIVFLFVSSLVYFILFICEFFVYVCFPNKWMNEWCHKQQSGIYFFYFVCPVLGRGS